MIDSDLLDEDRSVSLEDVGAPDWIAATVVAPDEAEHLILAFGPDIGVGGALYDPLAREAPHEQVGRLGGGWRERIWGDLARCGRPTAAGQPCRRMVGAPGESCTQHRGLPKAAARPPRRRMPRAICPHCGANVTVAPKRRTFTPHYIFRESPEGDEWGERCPMSGQPAEAESL
jgi:hypothetical protein